MPEATSRVRPWRRALLPIPLVVALLLIVGQADVVPLAVVVLAVVAQLRVLSPTVDRRLSAALHTFGHRVSAVVGAVLLGVVQLVLVPVSAVAWLLGRDLADRSGGRFERRRSGRSTDHRSFARERATSRTASHRERAWTTAALVVGLVVAFLAVDAGLGWTWGRLVDDPPAAAESSDADPTSLPYRSTPFLYVEPADVASPTVNVTDGVRRSYETGPSGPDTPVVWFFGGSALWGYGLADEDTIPSQVARRAEAAGQAIRVVNLGQPGDVAWQELLRFERRLAHDDAPDLVVFYDGVNDLRVQTSQPPRSDPSHFGQDATSRRLTTEPIDHAPLEPIQEVGLDDDLHDLWEAYTDTSAIGRVVSGVQGLFDEDHEPDPEAAPSASVDPVDAAAEVHERFVELATALARAHDVTPAFFAQPVRPGSDEAGVYETLIDRFEAPVVDLGGTVEGRDPATVFLDELHLTERGARTVAAAIWAQIGPAAEGAAR